MAGYFFFKVSFLRKSEGYDHDFQVIQTEQINSSKIRYENNFLKIVRKKPFLTPKIHPQNSEYRYPFFELGNQSELVLTPIVGVLFQILNAMN